MKNKDKIFYYGIIFLIVFVVVVIDQLTKHLVSTNLIINENIKIIPNFFHIEYITNDGAAWGMFSGNVFMMLGIPLLAVIAFVYILINGDFKEKKYLCIALALMLGGTIGNYIDRLISGHVVDFLSFRFGSYHFPNFNAADSFLVIGAVLLGIDVLILDHFRNKKSDINVS